MGGGQRPYQRPEWWFGRASAEFPPSSTRGVRAVPGELPKKSPRWSRRSTTCYRVLVATSRKHGRPCRRPEPLPAVRSVPSRLLPSGGHHAGACHAPVLLRSVRLGDVQRPRGLPEEQRRVRLPRSLPNRHEQRGRPVPHTLWSRLRAFFLCGFQLCGVRRALGAKHRGRIVLGEFVSLLLQPPCHIVQRVPGGLLRSRRRDNPAGLRVLLRPRGQLYDLYGAAHVQL